MGQVVQKHIHSENGGQSFLQDVDYAYNIKGQLTRMNNPENLGNDVFALRFYFNIEYKSTVFIHFKHKKLMDWRAFLNLYKRKMYQV